MCKLNAGLHPGEFEHLVMLAALRIGRDAYGVSIIEEPASMWDGLAPELGR